MTWMPSPSFPGNSDHEEFEVKSRVDGNQMPCLRWHRVSDGRAARQSGPQAIPASLHAAGGRRSKLDPLGYV
jgi:hypothetical protein